MEEHHPFFDPQAEARAQARRHALTMAVVAMMCALGFVGWFVIR